MLLDVLGLLSACSYALDCVEAELEACGIHECLHGGAAGDQR